MECIQQVNTHTTLLVVPIVVVSSYPELGAKLVSIKGIPITEIVPSSSSANTPRRGHFLQIVLGAME